MNTLMIVGVSALLPTPTHHAYICASGSLGYHAFREMLEVGGGNHLHDPHAASSATTTTTSTYFYGNNPSIALITDIDLREKTLIGKVECGGDCQGDETASPPHNPSPSSSFTLVGEGGVVAMPISIIHSVVSINNALPLWRQILNKAPHTTRASSLLSNCKNKKNSRHLHLTTYGNVSPSTGEAFLMECGELETVDLQAFCQVEVVGSSFLMMCTSLSSIDLTPFRNVTCIGQAFLESCRSLTEINLSALGNVTTINPMFLGGCVGLKSIDLTPLTSVVTIGSWFLSDCSGLKSINFTGLCNLKTLFSSFLFRCSQLESIDLTPLRNLESLGFSFISDCTNLKIIKLDNSNFALREILRQRHPDKLFYDKRELNEK